MKKWKETRLKGKWRFAIWYGLVISLLLAFDYCLIKLILNFKTSLNDFLKAWSLLMPFSFLIGIFGWKVMEIEWQKNAR
ncbi:hypothetical protein [Peribacillus acanthi]|uniref:hypothetical protein n=1 Tax=Peribacillus acanthi TaxID=2171554 RepID=UPI000D3E4C0D|nr:hypothetical protein [Peribacillus acanthi]